MVAAHVTKGKSYVKNVCILSIQKIQMIKYIYIYITYNCIYIYITYNLSDEKTIIEKTKRHIL